MIKSAQEFIALCDSSDKEELERIRSEEASLQVWEEVVKYYPEYQRQILFNDSIGDEVLRMLAVSEDVAVRSHLAKKRRLPKDIFELLAVDSDPRPRVRIAENDKVPVEILERLLKDPDADVALAASRKMEYVLSKQQKK